jgi:peptide chain release factor 2
MVLNSESSCFEAHFDYDNKVATIAEFEAKMTESDFWNNQERAQQTVSDLKVLRGVVQPLRDAISRLSDIRDLIEMAADEPGMEADILGEIQGVTTIIEQLELAALLNGPLDSCGAILSVHARDGGLDANDWAEILLGMYLSWAKRKGYEAELLDRSDNEEAGITQATVAIRGPMAYGYLKGEEGMHRLVRNSPFNADGKRQTSFAAVDVSPEINDSVEIDIPEKDVREDVYRASGAGGQHVNKTSSAIRLTHIPTGIAVQCQNDRSQHKNRAQAWKMLKSRMARLEEEKREAEQAVKYKNKARVGFGSQIRNYFLHPDQRVKDARTGFQMGSFHAVIDGEIQGFLDSYLQWRIAEETQS